MKAEEMWDNYSRDNDVSNKIYEAWSFGSESDKLAELVLQGVKTATSSLYALYEIGQEPLPEEGDYSVILDSNAEAKCIIITTKVYVTSFDKVTEKHAYKEGEGDRSLEYWRKSHREFFADCLREVGLFFDETMDIVCEEFEVVYM